VQDDGDKMAEIRMSNWLVLLFCGGYDDVTIMALAHQNALNALAFTRFWSNCLRK
jgi:PP-loop superfamily ATP-utilizing enzyme